jgi:AbrB family looped-hinge helix DNA binding protein
LGRWEPESFTVLQGKHIDIDRKTLYHKDMIAVTVSSKYQIVIPKEARKALGITSGMRLQAILEPSGLRLVKEPSIDQIRGLLSGMVVDDATIRSEEERILS